MGGLQTVSLKVLNRSLHDWFLYKMVVIAHIEGKTKYNMKLSFSSQSVII